MTRALWIMIAGPYTGGARTAGDRARNLQALNRAAYRVFRRGHVPVIGVNMALPIIASARGKSRRARVYNQLMMPISLALASRCDAVLRIGGRSVGADAEVERVLAAGGRLFQSLRDIPQVRGNRIATRR